MDAEFRYLDGPFQGESRVIRKDFATIGRDPSADLTFDARADEGVSGRHAAVYRQGGQWMLRDLGGAGGTWLNDRRLRADTPLSPGDVIRLGREGPRIGFGPREPGAPAPAAAPAITRTAAAPTPAPVPPRPAPAPVRAPQPAPRRSRLPLVGAVVVVAAVVAGYALLNRAALPSAPRNPGTSAPPHLSTSAPPDSGTPLALDSVLRRAAGTVVLVVAGYQDGSWPVGSGVVLEARNDTAWVATSARLAADPRGRPPVRIGLLLPGADGYLRGELAVPLDGSGAALIRVRTSGGALASAPLGEAPGAADSVAVIGVVLGADSLPAGNWRQEGLRVSGTAAAMAASAGAADRVDAPGHGAGPGHPVFDRDGRLVGLVAGVDSAAPGRLRVIPAARLRGLLERRPTRE